MFIKQAVMKLILTGMLLLLIGFTTNAFAVYYNYWTWNTGQSSAYGVDGWVGIDGVDRLIYYSGTTAYIHQVTAAGNPNLHPLNPDATGPIAT